ncbi:uncharacterized protein LOC115624841 [Scaptodrosophila lebanonensis]|uniref:Uncharacterized protein LOC115624841 n=1 Tax=Drosophila lebanonensis TaxID=7225 RepID=A0A6J2TJB7_DROLE|nr:uncharacterized protein LOC115624841 [Scaptodrosophila lebanonensis]
MWPIVLFSLPLCIWAIVNPSNESANTVIYMLPESELGPHTWQVGVECLHQFAQIFFHRKPVERLTRAYNLLLANVYNMSAPADQILYGYSKVINEAATAANATRDEIFQLRVVSDRNYKMTLLNAGEILLSDNYVIVVDSVTRLHNLMDNYISQMRSWNPGARFLVLFNSAKFHHKPLSVATQIFNDLMQNFYVHRVALIFATSATEYNLLVNDYYSNVDCRILNVQSVGQCLNGKLFPDAQSVQAAMTDYISGFSPKNCTFDVCATIAAPFVEADCVLGLEMRILGFMRNRLQFQINQSCTREARGDIDSGSGNWSGLLGKLTDGECDFIIGGFYPDNDVADFFWGSDCYLQDAYTWYIRLAEHRPAWQAMVAIFSLGTWLCLFGTLLISWLSWYFLVQVLPEPQYYQQLSLTAINALAVSISVAVYERPLCESTRLFFMALTLYGLNIGATYTSKMIETFQDPGYLHQLDKLEEAMEAGIPFGGREESRDWFENENDMWIFDAYNTTSAFIPLTENLLAVKNGERCILSNRMYIMQNIFADDIYAFSYNVFSSPIQMIMKAGFPFIFEMNTIIRFMRDVGIFQKIDADFRYNNTYLNRIAKMRPEFTDNVIVLTTEHLKGPFGILIVGVWGASLTFLVELWCGRRRSRQLRQLRRQHRNLRRQKRKYTRQMHVAPASIRFTPLKRRKVL